MLKAAMLGAVILAAGSLVGLAGSMSSVAFADAATAPAEKVDVKNTKCIVMPEDDAGDKTVEYKNKLYHLCCGGCVKKLNKDPEKYVKALEADPAKYGVTK